MTWIYDYRALEARLADAERELEVAREGYRKLASDYLERHMQLAEALDLARDAARETERSAERIVELETQAAARTLLVEKLARWISNHATDMPPDHACAECVPGGPIVIVGHRCGRHEALRFIAEIASRQEVEAMGAWESCHDARGCHGAMKWCDLCGDVSASCSDRACDLHGGESSHADCDPDEWADDSADIEREMGDKCYGHQHQDRVGRPHLQPIQAVG